MGNLFYDEPRGSDDDEFRVGDLVVRINDDFRTLLEGHLYTVEHVSLNGSIRCHGHTCSGSACNFRPATAEDERVLPYG